MENKTKHLEMIQGVVNRLSTNSFLLKGWSVLLISALFALSAPGRNMAFVFIAYVPAIVFWGLDGYFLWQERLFRKLYDHVRTLNAETDFSMDTTAFRSDPSTKNWLDAVSSTTIMAFHGTLISSIIVVMVVHLINR